MKRTLPALKLERSPLIYALAQVRFSPVLRMASYIADLQESFRKSGYPRFQTERIDEILVGAQPTFGSSQRWVFASKDGHAAIVLTENFIVLETSSYETFDEFVDGFGRVLEELHDTVEMELAERIGLRYVDLLGTDESGSWRRFVHEGLRGIPREDLELQDQRHKVELRGPTRKGVLVIRIGQSDSTLLPPDIDADELTFDGPEFSLSTILDLDHFSVGQRDFSPKALVDEMWELHDHIDGAFRAAVTKEALTQWGAHEVDDS